MTNSVRTYSSLEMRPVIFSIFLMLTSHRPNIHEFVFYVPPYCSSAGGKFLVKVINVYLESLGKHWWSLIQQNKLFIMFKDLPIPSSVRKCPSRPKKHLTLKFSLCGHPFDNIYEYLFYATPFKDRMLLARGHHCLPA